MHYTTSCNTHSSAPEDGQNNRPNHVELIGIINKLLSLHIVGCLYHSISNVWSSKHHIYLKDSLPFQLLSHVLQLQNPTLISVTPQNRCEPTSPISVKSTLSQTTDICLCNLTSWYVYYTTIFALVSKNSSLVVFSPKLFKFLV